MLYPLSYEGRVGAVSASAGERPPARETTLPPLPDRLCRLACWTASAGWAGSGQRHRRPQREAGGVPGALTT